MKRSTFNLLPLMILVLGALLLITFAPVARAQAVGGGNDVIYRHGFNVVTPSGLWLPVPQWTHWGGNKRRTLNSGWCDVNGCAAP